jgi:hypothetical protein
MGAHRFPVTLLDEATGERSSAICVKKEWDYMGREVLTLADGREVMPAKANQLLMVPYTGRSDGTRKPNLEQNHSGVIHSSEHDEAMN